MTEACEALKMKLVQEAEGYILTLRIAPADLPETVILAGLNARFAIAFSEIGPDEQLQPKPDNKPKRRQNSNVMRAAIRCGEREFQVFLEKRFQQDWNAAIGQGAERAAEAMRMIIGADSRALIGTDETIRERFDKLDAEYLMWKRGQ